MQERIVGRVMGLWRYPVKSMAAEALEAVDVSWHGFAGDRRWAFIRDGRVRSGFPWLTMRERPDMGQFRPRLVDPSRPDGSAVMVSTPSGDELDVTDPALGSLLGHGARVIKQDRGIFDTFPISLLTLQTLASLSVAGSLALDVRRFRPNLLIYSTEARPYPEDAWVGAVLRVGGLRMRVDKRDQRCVMVNVDPVTTDRDPAVLRTIARERAACLGVYGSTIEPGRVEVGDEVSLQSAAG